MTPAQESLYGQIGEALVRAVNQEFTRVWAYVEQEEGVTSLKLFYASPTGVISYQTANVELAELFDSLWELSAQEIEKRWTNVTYMLDGDGSFEMDVNYDNIFDDESTSSSRRQAWIKKYLGEVEVQYPKPPGWVKS